MAIAGGAGRQPNRERSARRTSGLEVWAPSGGAGVSAAPQEAPSRSLRSMLRIDSNLPLQWGTMCQCDAELEQLRAALHEEATKAFRQVLSHHTTTACQPGKAPGSVSSLNASGLDDKHGQAGEWYVVVHLANSFEQGDGYWVSFRSDSSPNFKLCQAEAAQHLLMMLLANRPTGCTCMRARSGTSTGFAGAPLRCTTPRLQCQAFLQQGVGRDAGSQAPSVQAAQRASAYC